MRRNLDFDDSVISLINKFALEVRSLSGACVCVRGAGPHDVVVTRKDVLTLNASASLLLVHSTPRSEKISSYCD